MRVELCIYNRFALTFIIIILLNKMLRTKQQLTIIALVATMALAQERAPVFLDTDSLETMINMRTDADLKIFDCTVSD